ncbi:MAG TPA: hypothetical protein DD624_05990 [Alphaproteobacteria bacterium]|nr:hypothetical protein [Alphaproteobacteria bacterium]
MTKSMLTAVVVLIVLFAGCGAFIRTLQREEAAQDVGHFLIRHRLNNNVLFESVSLSLADEAVLNNVSLKMYDLPDLRVSVRKAAVHSYAEEHHIPSRLSATLTGVRFSLTEAAKALKTPDETVFADLSSFNPAEDLARHPLYALILAGCDTIDADVGIEYAYAPMAKEMRLNLDVKDACLGQWRLDTFLTGITNARQGRLMLALRHIVQRGGIVADLRDFLDGAAVANLRFSYAESGLVKGYKAFVDTLYLRLPNQESRAELDAKTVRRIVTYLSFSNAHRQRNTDLVNSFARFVKKPQKLVIQSKPHKTVHLSVLSGDFIRRLADLLLRLDVSLTVETAPD